MADKKQLKEFRGNLPSEVTQKPKIAVVVPVYNSAKTVEKCLRSLLDGTYSNIVVYAIDNASQDESVHIIEQVQKTDDRVKLIRRTSGSGSPAKPREEATKAALLDKSVDYITYLDADDFADPNHLENYADVIIHRSYLPGYLATPEGAGKTEDENQKIHQTNLRRPPDLIWASYRKVYKSHTYIPQEHKKLGEVRGMRRVIETAFGKGRRMQNWAICWQICFSRQVLEAISDEEWAWTETINQEDSALTLLAALRAESGYDTGKVTLNYVQHSVSEMNSGVSGVERTYTPEMIEKRNARLSDDAKLWDYARVTREHGLEMGGLFFAVSVCFHLNFILQHLLLGEGEWGVARFSISQDIKPKLRQIIFNRYTPIIHKLFAITCCALPYRSLLSLSEKLLSRHNNIELHQPEELV